MTPITSHLGRLKMNTIRLLGVCNQGSVSMSGYFIGVAGTVAGMEFSGDGK